jgi:hypothetical protein
MDSISIDATNILLKVDLTMRTLSKILLPHGYHSDFAVLTTLKDGVLGFAREENYKLFL